MSRASYFCGDPKEVAAQAQGFVDAGATFVGIADMVPLALGPEHAEATMARGAEISNILKGVEAPVPA